MTLVKYILRALVYTTLGYSIGVFTNQAEYQEVLQKYVREFKRSVRIEIELAKCKAELRDSLFVRDK